MCDLWETRYLVEKFRADQAEAELARLIPADHPKNLFRRLCEGLLQADNQCQQLYAELKEARDECQRLKDRLVPSLVLKSGQKCSFEEVILPCLRERPTISRPVRSVVVEDGYLVNEYQVMCIFCLRLSLEYQKASH